MPLPREETTPPVMKTYRAMDAHHTPAAAAGLPVLRRHRPGVARAPQFVGTVGGGGAAGAAGTLGAAGVLMAGASRMERCCPVPRDRWASNSDNTKKATARTAVARVRRFAVPR